MTYYDAGKACQVYNSLWYPRDGSLPVLGVDLLSFNGRKHLSVVDYQPTWERQEDDDDDDDASSSAFDYETMVLKPIREKYPSLQGRMSQRFYDESRFFSRHMLFGRYEDVSIVEREVMPAFMESVTEYVAMGRQRRRTTTKGNQGNNNGDHLGVYDTYSAHRDPAHGLLASTFGKEWADEFVFGFLFDRAEKDVFI